ncbi:hypothetical protein CONLIGDRAFT_676392 [Coniochaeta ligniaria NRRL 30616]|uniref:Uncharacterized protein n=1 Tax=Coniochaeta ligniaria NRRL 30616 TaxID=1408157 RepID=A0A1J7K5H3_9PEZI|nr:hypothetical protein CONLIGDRAFT_676392 [Coniochaeta ligniaria NRRL 30616]
MEVMEPQGDKDWSKTQSAIGDMIESSAQGITETKLVRRDPAEVKAFWNDVRRKLWIDEAEIYSDEDTPDPEVSVASVGEPFSDGHFGDGRSPSSELCHIAEGPLMGVAAPKSNDDDADWTSEYFSEDSMSENSRDHEDNRSTDSSFNRDWIGNYSHLNPDWINDSSHFNRDWTGDDDRTQHGSDNDSEHEDQQSNDAATPTANQATTTPREVDEQQQDRRDEGDARSLRLLKRGRTPSAEQAESAQGPPTNQNRTSWKRLRSGFKTWPLRSKLGTKLSDTNYQIKTNKTWPNSVVRSSKKAWRKVKGMLGGSKSTKR